MVITPPPPYHGRLDIRASWSMGDWRSFEQFVDFTDETLPEGAYLRAVVALRQDDLDLCSR